jgi:uncharacterized protein with WD repeat
MTEYRTSFNFFDTQMDVNGAFTMQTAQAMPGKNTPVLYNLPYDQRQFKTEAISQTNSAMIQPIPSAGSSGLFSPNGSPPQIFTSPTDASHFFVNQANGVFLTEQTKGHLGIKCVKKTTKKQLDKTSDVKYTLEYRRKRDRNNEAVRKSRDKAKKRQGELQTSVLGLNQQMDDIKNKMQRDRLNIARFVEEVTSQFQKQNQSDIMELILCRHPYINELIQNRF